MTGEFGPPKGERAMTTKTNVTAGGRRTPKSEN
jgi:hypothetical protein